MNLPAHTLQSMCQRVCGRRTVLHCLAFIALAFAVSFASCARPQEHQSGKDAMTRRFKICSCYLKTPRLRPRSPTDAGA